MLLGVWGILLAILYFSGNSYEDRAFILLQKQLDNHLSTEIQINKKGIHFSVLKNFPNASLRLNSILIKSSPNINLNEFDFQAKDTLLYAEEVSLLFNLKSLFSKKYELKKIVIANAKLNLLIDKSGSHNYKVFKSLETTEKDDSVKIELKHINLDNIIMNYIDAGQKLYVSTHTEKCDLFGTFSENNFSINLSASLQNLNISYKRKNYLDNTPAKLSLHITKSDNNYFFDKGSASLMGINLKLNGAYDVSNKYYQFVAHSKSALLNNISFPEWMQFLNKNNLLIEKGTLDINTTISGYSRQKGSTVISEFVIKKAGFKSKVKPINAKNIYLKGRYSLDNKGTTTIKLDTLSMYSDKSQISGTCSLQNLNHPVINGRIGGILELQKLMLFESIARRIELEGIIEGELIINGAISTKSEKWSTDLMNAFESGYLKISNANVKPLMNPLPQADVNGVIRLKGLNDVWLDGVSLRTGMSDLIIKGSVTNLPLFTGEKSEFPVYQCEVSSNEFHVEDFLIRDKKENVTGHHMVQLPDSMIVNAKIRINEFFFGKFSASLAEGNIHYQPKTLTINDFSMESQKGKIFSEMVISQYENRLTTKTTANFRQVDLGDVFYAFNNFGQKVISAENLDGSLTGTATVHADWDLYLKPILENLKLQSSFLIKDGELIEYQPLLGLSKFIEVEELKHIKFDQLETSIQIENEVVYLPETNINSSAISIIGSGQHDFENRYKYYMQVQLSDILWKKARSKKPENTEFGYVVDDGLGKTTIPLIIEGKDTEFEVFYDKKKGGSTFRAKVKEEKEEFKRLLRSDSKNESPDEKQEIRLVWEEDTSKSIQNQTEVNHQHQSEDPDQEFIIEWEDE